MNCLLIAVLLLAEGDFYSEDFEWLAVFSLTRIEANPNTVCVVVDTSNFVMIGRPERSRKLSLDNLDESGADSSQNLFG
jgi:hypothetical protein